MGLASGLRVVGSSDRPRQSRVHSHVGENHLTGHQHERVDYAFLVGVRDREKDSIASNEHGKDPIRLRELSGQDVEVIQHDDDLSQVDPGHPVLFRKSAKRFYLADRPTLDELR